MNERHHILMYMLVVALVLLSNLWYVSDEHTVLAVAVALVGIVLFVRELDHLR